MSGYITYSDVSNLTGTNLTQAVVEACITQGEAQVDGMLSKEDLTGDTSNGLLINAAHKFTQVWMIRRMQMDGSRPQSQSMGGLSYSNNLTQDTSALTKEAEDAVKEYMKIANNPDITSDADPEETVVREDHAMPSMQLDQSRVTEYHDKASNYGNQDTDNGT